MSFVYEVNLEIDSHRADDFAQWLTPHIQEMLSFDGFIEAQWLSRDCPDESNTKDVVLWTIQYTLTNRMAYETYLSTHAPRMRKEGIERFSTNFRASRRLLLHHKRFSHSSSE
jgi:hypothetical protein